MLIVLQWRLLIGRIHCLIFSPNSGCGVSAAGVLEAGGWPPRHHTGEDNKSNDMARAVASSGSADKDRALI